MPCCRWGSLLFAALVFFGVLPRIANGHLVMQPREVSVFVDSGGVSVQIRQWFHEGRDAARLRASADVDGDGLIAAGAELLGLEDRLLTAARSHLALSLDERPLVLHVKKKRVVLDGGPAVHPGRMLSFEAELVATGSFCPGLHSLRLEDAPQGDRGVVALQLHLAEGLEVTGEERLGATTALGATTDGVRHGGFGPGGGALLLKVLCGTLGSRPSALD